MNNKARIGKAQTSMLSRRADGWQLWVFPDRELPGFLPSYEMWSLFSAITFFLTRPTISIYPANHYLLIRIANIQPSGIGKPQTHKHMKTNLLTAIFITLSLFLPVRADEADIKGTTSPPAEKKPEIKKIKGWGSPIDPAGDCAFTTEGDKLTITVPGEGDPHDLSSELTSTTAPRVLQPLQGDFTLQVKVEGEFAPGDKGNQMLGAMSQDGENWTYGEPKELSAEAWANWDITGGVAAISTSAKSFSPVYSGLTVGKSGEQPNVEKTTPDGK